MIATLAERDEAIESAARLAGELEAAMLACDPNVADEIQKLRARLKVAERQRDDFMDTRARLEREVRVLRGLLA